MFGNKPKVKSLLDILVDMHAKGETILLGFGGREHRGFITAFGGDFAYFQITKGPGGVSIMGGQESDLVGRVKHVPLTAITSVAHIKEN